MTATTPDYDEIVRVVQLYVDGWSTHDVAKLKEAFHQNALIFFTEADGTLFQDVMWNCFAWDGEDPHTIHGRIISVQQAGDIAVVLLGFDNTANPESCWVDLHSLLRIEGVWKIMNKTATHSSRAAWAAPELAQR